MKYLIPFDFSEVSRNAVENAIKLVKVTGGDLFLLHIVKNRKDFKTQELKLRNYVESIPKKQDYSISFNVVIGDIFTDIGKIAEYHGADIIVMGTHGVDTLQKMFGSNAVKVINHATTPFIIFQENCKINQLKKIIMPISVETRSMQVLRFAVKLSKKFNAEIHLVGRHHKDEFLLHKENSNIILSKKFLVKNSVKHHFELVNVSKSDFLDYLLDYATMQKADMIACTYYSDSVMPMFEKFVQNIINNDQQIPVICVNAQSLYQVDSSLSFLTI